MSKGFKKTLGVLLAIIFVVGAVIGGMQLWAKDSLKPSNWGNSSTEQGEDKDNNGGMVVTPIFCEAIDLRIRSYSEEGEIIKNTVIEDEN